MGRSHRPRTVRKTRNAAIAAEERTYVKAPHSFVFAHTGVGSLVKQLSQDLRRVFEPYTASSLRVSKRNVLKDFINIAGPLNVTHLLYFTHPRADKLSAKRARHAANAAKKRQRGGKSLSSDPADFGDDDEEGVSLKGDAVAGDPENTAAGGVYMHLVRTPNGPSLTFRVLEYSLTKDVFTLVRRVFDARQFTTPPLLAMTGFGSTAAPGAKAPPPPHLRLMVDMFQNMLPPLNVQKIKLSTVRRVLLLSREVDSASGEEVIYLRHFHIRIENRSVSKALRRLGVGGAALRKRVPGGGLGPGGSGKSSGVPSLAKYASLDDYLTKASLLTDSGMSDVDDIAEVELPGSGGANSTSTNEALENVQKTKASSKRKQALADAKASHGFTHLATCRKATIRLTEIGPRLTLKLIKIEEGVNSGSVLYHSWQVKSAVEETVQLQQRQQKEAEKNARKTFQEQRRQAHEAAKAQHRQSCLEGMRKAGKLPADEAEADSQDDDAADVSREQQEPEADRVEEEDFDELIHQVTDDEAEKDAEEGEEEEEEQAGSRAAMPLAGVSQSRRSGRITRKKKKTKKLKIPRKHPAYKYLMEKEKSKEKSSGKKWSSRT